MTKPSTNSRLKPDKPPISEDQQAYRERINARNEAIQQAGPRPKDGVTFAKQPKGKD